ncbi:MFS transporter [Micromonospora sp. BRA006-A]|nr:MFS transporter [Micromonospora sp. BRA006-A]
MAVLLLAQPVNALFIAAVSGVGIAYVQDLLPGEPGRATTLFTNTFPIGAMLAGPLLGLSAQVGYRWAYGMSTALCAAGLLVLLLTRPRAVRTGARGRVTPGTGISSGRAAGRRWPRSAGTTPGRGRPCSARCSPAPSREPGRRAGRTRGRACSPGNAASRSSAPARSPGAWPRSPRRRAAPVPPPRGWARSPDQIFGVAARAASKRAITSDQFTRFHRRST